MIVNKSMFPVQTGFAAISNMQGRMSALQMQLGSGQKSPTLAGMGNDLAMSLSVRARLSRIEGFSASIGTINLRLGFYDNVMTRFDKIETEARNSALPGQYGTGDINIATLPGLSAARFDEIVTLLNSEIAGRYLFGGSVSDRAPLAQSNALIEGAGGRDGFRAVAEERRLADLGQSGLGRLTVSAGPGTVTLAEDGVHPFGFKLSSVASSTPAIAATSLAGPPPARGFELIGPDQPLAGQTVTIGLTLPDGTETQVTLTAAAEPGGPGSYVIGSTLEETAENFAAALTAGLGRAAGTVLTSASSFAAAENFFNAAGEPVVRVAGDPATATGLRLATADDTVLWYRGESPAISAEGLGRLSVSTQGDTVTLGEKAPVSAAHGFSLVDVSASNPAIAVTPAPGATPADPDAYGVGFDALNPPAIGDTVSVTIARPDGTQTTLTLTAAAGPVTGAGQFAIGATPGETATDFSRALEASLHQAASAAEGNPRQAVSAQVDESTRVSYGVAANEAGPLRMLRTLAALSISNFPGSDETARGRFDAMAERQQAQMSESLNTERGSIEIITMELGIARATAANSAKRHTDYKAQLENLLSDVETVAPENVAMEILALQTRLEASYQVTAMVSQLSLAKYI